MMRPAIVDAIARERTGTALKVLLIQPPSSYELADKLFMHEPLALEYLGAGLKLDGHKVEVLDARLEPRIEPPFRRFDPDVVGLTGYTSDLPAVKKIASLVKSLNPRILTVIGGHHATVQPDDYNLPEVDLVVVGEGVCAMREIVNRFERGEAFSGIDGLAFPGTAMSHSTKRPYTDLNELPFPDRTLTLRYRNHYFSEWLKPLASIRTSLGCTNRCSFCALWSITDGRYLRRRPDSVIEELLMIEEENVFFCDDESMCDTQRMDTLADLIREAGIRKRYFLHARADTVVNHPGLFTKWRNIGLDQIFIGMESFSDEWLRNLKKGLTTSQQEEAVRILDRLGILVYASFIVDPAFSREDFRALVEYIRRLKLKHASFSILTPLPGTELHAEREDELITRRPELYDFLHVVLPTTLPLRDFYAEYARLYESAIPFRYAVRALRRYSLRGLLHRLILKPGALRKIRQGYLAHY
jgi:radical SAM superfamily enzyme YgiQ (UPF0313 family)